MAEPLSHIHAPGRRDPALRLHTSEPDDGGEEITDPRHYRAVETGLKPARLVIHPRTGPSRSPGYATLLDIIIDRQFGAAFTLIYAHRGNDKSCTQTHANLDVSRTQTNEESVAGSFRRHG